MLLEDLINRLLTTSNFMDNQDEVKSIIQNLNIITNKNSFIINSKDTQVTAKLISAKQYTFLLTTLLLQMPTKQLRIPIFFGSIPLKQYKLLRMFVIWCS